MVRWRAVGLLLYVQWWLGTKIAKGRNLRIDRVVSAHRTGIAAFTREGVALEDGDSLAVNCVVFGTGWKCDYGFLPEEAHRTLGSDEDGFHLYRHMLHQDLPNLFFIGRTLTFLSILTYCLQVRWLAELINGRFALPTREVMLNEIQLLKNWKRGWMPFSGRRSARLLLHMLYYHAELPRDFGANPLRKRGVLAPLKERFVPYQPSDYRPIVVGDWEAAEGRVVKQSCHLALYNRQISAQGQTETNHAVLRMSGLTLEPDISCRIPFVRNQKQTLTDT